MKVFKFNFINFDCDIGVTPLSPIVSTTITVTATDISTGLIYFIEVKNEWARKGTNFAWDPVLGQEQVITTNVNAQMTDNGNNQYSYTNSVVRPGKITISVI